MPPSRAAVALPAPRSAVTSGFTPRRSCSPRRARSGRNSAACGRVILLRRACRQCWTGAASERETAMLLLLAAVATACPTEPRTAAGLRQAEDRWVAALEARDQAALACRLAPDFADNAWQGAVHRRDAVLARLPPRPPSTLQLSALTISVLGATGMVRGLNPQVAPDGK